MLTRLSIPLLAAGLSLLAVAAPAKADRVVLLPPDGSDEQERLDDIEEALAVAILAVGHEAVTERAPVGDAPAPETANEMRAIAELQGAQYLVHPRVTTLHDSYRLALRVGYAPEGRVEQLEVLVYEANEAERLQEVFAALLRPAGVGDDAVRLTADPPPPGAGSAEADPAADAEAERRREEEEARQREFLAREQERAEAEARTEEEAFAARERYGTPKLWMVSLGLDFRPVIAHPTDRAGGVLGSLSVRAGRGFTEVPGLEARVALDIVTGAASGFVLAGGAVYMFSPFAYVPLHIGATVELGLFQALSGNRVPSFMVRASPVVAWRPFGQFYLEGALPEIQIYTAHGGIMTLGLSVRGGFRF
jgi:hypothetical protein